MRRLGLILVVIAAMACGVPAVSAATTWRIVPAPTPAGTVLSAFNGVSCLGADSCTAVGYYGVTHNSSIDRTLAEHWNGSAWAIQPTPTPAGGGLLSGVSCVSRVLCVAVGQGERGVFSEVWDGAAWRVVAMPQPAGAAATLAGVSCSSASACMAVGMQPDGLGSELPVAERWGSGAWQITMPVNPAGGGGLSGVSCRSGACTAVGFLATGGTLAEAFNSSSWSIQATPNLTESFLDGIACVSLANCTGVGGAFGITSGAHIDPLAEHFDGTSWLQQSTPLQPGPDGFDTWLTSVSCPRTNACTAVGSGNDSLTLAEARDGSTWQLQTTPNPAGTTRSQLTGVSCRSEAVCTAVGLAYTSGGLAALAETTG